MSSSSSFATRQSLPHLSQIIHLEPEKEPWCAGYAPSQGRRCHCSTNAPGRRCAMRLLDEATEELRAGRCIDDLLDQLAPQVLCRRWHQSQANDLTSRWQKEIRLFMRLQSPPLRESSSRSTRQPTQLSTRTVNREPTRAILSESSLTNVEEQCSELIQTLQETLVELRRLQALQASVSIPSSTIGTSSPRARDRGNASTTRHARTSNGSVSSIESPQRTTFVTRPANASSSRSAASTSTYQLPPRAVPRTESRAERQNADSSLRVNLHAPRRAIEGPCGICLEALKSIESDDSDEEYDSYIDSDSDDDEDYNEGNEEDCEQEEQSLVYCKAQCGNNFHETCLHEWLEHSIQPTCPMCRCAWRD